MPTFLHAPLLWGLLLVGVPVLIHLINMMRHRRQPWAAMEFLLLSRKKNRTWVIFKELLLLALRMLAVALIVLVVAQPLLRNQLGALLGGGKTHHILLLDDSFSMSDRKDGASVMDRAKQVVERIGAMADGRAERQSFTMLRFSRAARTGHRAQPDLLQVPVDAEFLGRLRDALQSIGPSQLAVGPGDALQAVERLLGEGADETRVVYLITDFRRKDWDQAKQLKTRLASLESKGARLRLIDCADRTRANLAIECLEPVWGVRAADVSMFMEVEVRNYDTADARGVSVAIERDGQASPAVSIEKIPPGKSVSERFEIRFTGAGTHRVTARLDGDPIAVDNQRHAVLDVAPEVRVLIIDGSDDAAGSFPLSAALSPGGVRTGIQPRVETPRFLSASALDSFDTIYLTDVDRLDPEAVKALERFVSDGGGLVFFAGPRCRADLLNESLWREGRGLLPVPLGAESELVIDRLDKVPDIEATDHPLLSIFGGKDNSFLTSINVNRYFSVPDDWKPEDGSGVRVIAKLRNGAPLAVERPFGKGRVIAWLTTAAPIWNNAANNPSYSVLMQETQAYLANFTAASQLLPVGSPLDLSLDQARYQPHVRFLSPGRQGREASSVEAAPDGKGRLDVRFADTDAAGVYEAKLLTASGIDESRFFALNVDTREGDLARLDGSQLAARLEGLDYSYDKSDAFQADSNELNGFNMSDALIYLLIFLLIAEQLLAWSCSYHPPRGGRTALPRRGGVA